ncbi:phosphatase PAP2 family protein [Nocardiopsis composta]
MSDRKGCRSARASGRVGRRTGDRSARGPVRGGALPGAPECAECADGRGVGRRIGRRPVGAGLGLLAGALHAGGHRPGGAGAVHRPAPAAVLERARRARRAPVTGAARVGHRQRRGEGAALRPRPYWYDPGIRPLATESTFGAPSGHAQLSTTFWGYLAAQSARRAVWAGAAVLVALICLSRLYLGVHFFTDIALGLALGALLLWLALRYEDALLRRWRALSLPVQLLLAAVLSTAPVALVAAYQAVLRAGWSVPEEWAGAVPPDVAGEALAHTAALGGGLLGAVAGFTVLDRRGWYSADGSLITRAARYVTGITGVLVIWAVVRLAVPETAGAVGEYIGYLLISLWAALGAPELFVRLRMADRPDRDRAGAHA